MHDEIAIKQHVEYAEGRFHGYVDVGTGDFDDGAPMASEALVFMAVSVNENFKIPVGYFLVKGLSGEERANLVKECLVRLHDVGVQVVSHTCDGPSCHITMMKVLGATISPPNLLPTIPHPADPEKKVQLILDVCHMLKNVRNVFEKGQIFKTQEGETINWQYLVELGKACKYCQISAYLNLRITGTNKMFN